MGAKYREVGKCMLDMKEGSRVAINLQITGREFLRSPRGLPPFCLSISGRRCIYRHGLDFTAPG